MYSIENSFKYYTLAFYGIAIDIASAAIDMANSIIKCNLDHMNALYVSL